MRFAGPMHRVAIVKMVGGRPDAEIRITRDERHGRRAKPELFAASDAARQTNDGNGKDNSAESKLQTIHPQEVIEAAAPGNKFLLRLQTGLVSTLLPKPGFTDIFLSDLLFGGFYGGNRI